jgi:Ca2+-binding EF-hand superfamily protein
MGCGMSSYPDIYSKNNKGLFELKPAFDALKLSENDIGRLYKYFRELDLTDSGTIEVAELEVYMKTESVPFTMRVLKMYDYDNTGQLDFQEFVFMLWNYCTLDRQHFGTSCPLSLL